MKNALVVQWWNNTRDMEMVKGDQKLSFASMRGNKFIMLSLGLTV